MCGRERDLARYGLPASRANPVIHPFPHVPTAGHATFPLDALPVSHEGEQRKKRRKAELDGGRSGRTHWKDKEKKQTDEIVLFCSAV
ncbi:hypothetical protein SKAU_G00162450 [Synaphobranchus kaupii]|uniref:Uncharacterized protein n=1 Tax=Synaphobranchus kaupii TaxID=118154 RepID=A0A9Q1FJD4_SYNKA|nr:hypothetical protein SKAU_G00162450 [Synaphobranchus kaupii]